MGTIGYERGPNYLTAASRAHLDLLLVHAPMVAGHTPGEAGIRTSPLLASPRPAWDSGSVLYIKSAAVQRVPTKIS